MSRRAVAVILAFTAACGSSSITVAAGPATEAHPYRDLPDVPRRTVAAELPSQYELPTVTVQRRRTVVRPSRSAPPRRAAGATAPLACIRGHESDTSGGYRAVNPNGHYGAYQFDQTTWRGAVTRAGHPQYADTRPDHAPAEAQDAAAAQLFAERGLQPWPPARGCA